MKSYIQQLSNVTFRLLVILLMYTISRFFFFFANYTQFSQDTPLELIKIFLVGIRFDATAVIEINFVFIILYSLPLKFACNKKYLRILTILFFVVNSLVLLLNFTDAEYFKYTAKRSTADLFGYIFISNDTATLMPQFVRDFWYVPLGWIITVLLGIYLIRKIPYPTVEYKITLWKSAIVAGLSMIIYVGILFVIMRGVGLKPVRIITAARYTSSQNIPLLLNTPFCIIHTLEENEEKFATYFTDTELKKWYNPVQQIKADTLRRDNVVIIILESFSYDFIGALNGGKTYTPHLDSIIRNSLLFENAFANGKKSIEALPAIFAGLPALSDNPYISSRYAGNALEAMPLVLSRLGYQTSFFHGGRNGTMGFDDFSNIAGIKKYYGLNEYKGPEAYDGFWGIFDEPFLHFYAENLKIMQQPFMSAVFTLSSHHPYNVPENLKHLFPADETKLEQSIRYTDYALGRFFKEIESMPWYKNTLFVFSADHTARDESNQGDKSIKAYRIPIVFFHPGNNYFKGRSQKIVQQTDIMPTIYEYLGINTPFISFGSSVFSKDANWAIYYLSGIYKFIENNTVITFDGENIISAEYLIQKPGMHKVPDTKSDEFLQMVNKMKAIIQQYHTRLINNQLMVQKK